MSFHTILSPQPSSKCTGIGTPCTTQVFDWSWKLAKVDGKVWCNLQEIQVLRWIAEESDSPEEAEAVVNGLRVKHISRSRYPCIVPHQAQLQTAEKDCQRADQVRTSSETRTFNGVVNVQNGRFQGLCLATGASATMFF